MKSSMPHWPIYILSLQDADARREPLVKALSSLQLDSQIIFGIDGRNGLPDEWHSDVDRRAASRMLGRDITDGELACALSHREIYRKVITLNLPGAIILEDDAVIGPRFAEFAKNRCYLQAPLMMLDHSHARVSGTTDEIMPGVSMRRLALPSCLTTAYSISTKAAAALQVEASPICGPADWPGDIVALGAVVLHPRIVGHPDPSIAHSHLEHGRQAMPSNKNTLRRAVSRWMDPSHWRRWVTKRRSVRIS